MADTKISALTELAAEPAADDEFVLNDKSDTTMAASGTDKRMRYDRISGLWVPKTIIDAKGDLIAGSAADTAARIAVGADGTSLTADSTAASGLAWTAPAPRQLPPTGVTYQSFTRYIPTVNASPLTSGGLRMTALWLPKGTVVTSMSWVSGTTALSLGTSPHSWVALFDSSLALLRQSTDNTAPAWAANTMRTVNLSSTFTTTYSGLHYAGLMIAMTGGTLPSLMCMALAASATMTNLAPSLSGASTTGLGATAPNPAAAITAGALNLPWAGVA